VFFSLLKVVLFDKIKMWISGLDYFGYEKGILSLKDPFSGKLLTNEHQ